MGAKNNISSANPNRLKVFRENRINISETLDCYIEFKTEDAKQYSGKIINLSRFGARAEFKELPSALGVNQISENCVIWINNQQVFKGKMLVKNEYEAKDGNLGLGLQVSEGTIDTDNLFALMEYQTNQTKLNSARSILQIIPQISAEFKTHVADLGALLSEIKFILDREEIEIKASTFSETQKQKMFEQSIHLAMTMYANEIRMILQDLGEKVSQLDLDSELIYKKYFRTVFHPLSLGSGFFERAYKKPLGYAGDYGLMLMLYEYKDIGRTLFDKFFHRYACNEPAAIANRNRVDFLSELAFQRFMESKDSEQEFVITSVACGPAKELEAFIQKVKEIKSNRAIKIICIDQESKALEHAQNSLREATKGLKNINLVFVQEDAVIGFLKNERLNNEVNDSDVIICAGLFDYLSKRVSEKLLEILTSKIRARGEIYIGNFSPDNPDQFSMEYFMEWKLIHRTEEQLLDLVPQSICENLSLHKEVISESLGLNLFLKIKKD